MTSPHCPPAAEPIPDFFWDDLLAYIEERRVIPILGPELFTVPDGGGGEVPLPHLLALRLAERLRVPLDPASAGDHPLNDVVSRYLQGGGRREDIYPRVRNLLKELAPPVPPALRALARIRHFNVFVTTTFDGLLAQALDEERFGGAPTTQSLAFAPNRTQDLAPGAANAAAPTVFHLFGRVSASPDYVVTEEDTLEFFTALQSETRRPQLLFDELKTHHLLLRGGTLPDWLSRFFLRTAKSHRLSLQREESEIVAGHRARHDSAFGGFLRTFSYRTQIFQQGNAAEFVTELAARYAARHPASVAPHTPAPASPAASPATGETMRAGSVFISYASQDLPAVQKLRDALDDAGIEVWFDKRRLESGDDFDQQIRRNIRGCSFFLPVISASTQARHEGYFRLEWSLAAERSQLIADSIPFILPVLIDPIPEAEALVPERFLKFQWSRLPGGQPTPEFVERLVRLIRDYRKREKGLL